MNAVTEKAKAEIKPAAPAPVIAEKKRDFMIDESRVQLAEYARQEWIANVEEDTTVDDILQPGFFALVAVKMRPYDHIEVRSDDGTWIANFLVTACSRNWARTAFLSKFDLTTGEKLDTSGARHEVKWKGPQHKWTVIRKSDGEKVNTGSLTEREASDWLRAHEETIQ